MQKNLLMIGAAVAALAVGGYAFMGGNGPADSLSPAQSNADSTQIAASETVAGGDAAEIDTSRVIDMVRGNPDAPVTIVEYSSFTCPHCANFNQGVYNQIIENYVETGQVRYIKREVYFDAYGLWAALVARCGGPERYYGVAEMLYQNQRDWAGTQDGAQAADNLRRIGRRAGMSDEQLNVCLSDRDMATALMEVYRANAEEYGIRSTPSFVINDQLYSNMSYAEFETAIATARGD